MRFSSRALLAITVLFALALAGAWVLYGILSSVTTGTWAGFRLGGAAAGFVVLFLLLHKAYTEAFGKNVVKVHLVFDEAAPPDAFGDGTRCSYSLFNRDTLQQTAEKSVQLLREGAGMVFYVQSQSAHDLICVDLLTPDGQHWQSGHHALHVAPVEMGRHGSPS